MAMKIDNAYYYYMSTYANREVTKYDSHKKSELRKVYNRIVKTNKESPLYKISQLDEAKRYAIDIKENAKSVQNVVASLSDKYGSFEDSFQKKVAVSSDADAVSVKYVGDGNEGTSKESFDIEIKQLASPQINTGNFLSNDTLSFVPGSYSFDLTTNTSSYEFQYSVNKNDTNEDILNKLNNIINNSNLGIDSRIISDDSGKSALELISHQTGLSEDEPYLFAITPAADNGSMNAMTTLGINYVSQTAHNSDFVLDGIEHSSLSNTFTINNMFELTLKKENAEGEKTSIGFKGNTEAVADNVQTLIDTYNDFLHTAESYYDTQSNAGNKLLRDMSALTKRSKASLENIGLMVSENGSLSIDREILAQAVNSDKATDTFQTLNKFKDAIGTTADTAAIDPMNYVNKVVVAYKNPGHNFNTPYITSIYSGLMMDSYA